LISALPLDDDDITRGEGALYETGIDINQRRRVMDAKLGMRQSFSHPYVDEAGRRRLDTPDQFLYEYFYGKLSPEEQVEVALNAVQNGGFNPPERKLEHPLVVQWCAAAALPLPDIIGALMGYNFCMARDLTCMRAFWTGCRKLADPVWWNSGAYEVLSMRIDTIQWLINVLWAGMMAPYPHPESKSKTHKSTGMLSHRVPTWAPYGSVPYAPLTGEERTDRLRALRALHLMLDSHIMATLLIDDDNVTKKEWARCMPDIESVFHNGSMPDRTRFLFNINLVGKTPDAELTSLERLYSRVVPVKGSGRTAKIKMDEVFSTAPLCIPYVMDIVLKGLLGVDEVPISKSWPSWSTRRAIYRRFFYSPPDLNWIKHWLGENVQIARAALMTDIADMVRVMPWAEPVLNEWYDWKAYSSTVCLSMDVVRRQCDYIHKLCKGDERRWLTSVFAKGVNDPKLAEYTQNWVPQMKVAFIIPPRKCVLAERKGIPPERDTMCIECNTRKARFSGTCEFCYETMLRKDMQLRCMRVVVEQAKLCDDYKSELAQRTNHVTITGSSIPEADPSSTVGVPTSHFFTSSIIIAPVTCSVNYMLPNTYDGGSNTGGLSSDSTVESGRSYSIGKHLSSVFAHVINKLSCRPPKSEFYEDICARFEKCDVHRVYNMDLREYGGYKCKWPPSREDDETDPLVCNYSISFVGAMLPKWVVQDIKTVVDAYAAKHDRRLGFKWLNICFGVSAWVVNRFDDAIDNFEEKKRKRPKPEILDGLNDYDYSVISEFVHQLVHRNHFKIYDLPKNVLDAQLRTAHMIYGDDIEHVGEYYRCIVCNRISCHVIDPIEQPVMVLDDGAAIPGTKKTKSKAMAKTFNALVKKTLSTGISTANGTRHTRFVPVKMPLNGKPDKEPLTDIGAFPMHALAALGALKWKKDALQIGNQLTFDPGTGMRTCAPHVRRSGARRNGGAAAINNALESDKDFAKEVDEDDQFNLEWEALMKTAKPSDAGYDEDCEKKRKKKERTVVGNARKWKLGCGCARHPEMPFNILGKAIRLQQPHNKKNMHMIWVACVDCLQPTRFLPAFSYGDLYRCPKCMNSMYGHEAILTVSGVARIERLIPSAPSHLTLMKKVLEKTPDLNWIGNKNVIKSQAIQMSLESIGSMIERYLLKEAPVISELQYKAAHSISRQCFVCPTRTTEYKTARLIDTEKSQIILVYLCREHSPTWLINSPAPITVHEALTGIANKWSCDMSMLIEMGMNLTFDR